MPKLTKGIATPATIFGTSVLDDAFFRATTVVCEALDTEEFRNADSDADPGKVLGWMVIVKLTASLVDRLLSEEEEEEEEDVVGAFAGAGRTRLALDADSIWR